MQQGLPATEPEQPKAPAAPPSLKLEGLDAAQEAQLLSNLPAGWRPGMPINFAGAAPHENMQFQPLMLPRNVALRDGEAELYFLLRLSKLQICHYHHQPRLHSQPHIRSQQQKSKSNQISPSLRQLHSLSSQYSSPLTSLPSHNSLWRRWT